MGALFFEYRGSRIAHNSICGKIKIIIWQRANMPCLRPGAFKAYLAFLRKRLIAEFKIVFLGFG